MRLSHWLGIAGAIVVVCLALPAMWGASGNIPAKFLSPAVAGSVASPHVMLAAPVGTAQGSGVHIGNGYILSAAHVVGANSEMILTDSSGRKMTAKVLWANPVYDIALLAVADNDGLEAAPLSCAPNYVGQKVTAYGNPMGIANVYTRLEVNGAKRQYAIWPEVVPVDGAVVYGQSGGGIIDENGNTVGVTVGLVPTPYGIAALGWFVPGAAVCHLMGRSA